MKLSENKRILIASVAALVLWSVFTFLLHWNIIASSIISIVSYLGFYFLTTPEMTNKDLLALNEQMNEDIKNIVKQADDYNETFKIYGKKIKNTEVKELIENLVNKGDYIVNYCKNHLETASQSQYFLTYYFESANKIISNYFKMEKALLSDEHKKELHDNTVKSLINLNTLFEAQLNNYNSNDINELKIESDLLETTIKMGEFKS